MDKLLDQKQAAEILGISPGTLSVWRSTKRRALKYVKLGRTVRYREKDLLDFIARGSVTPGAAPEGDRR